MININQYQTSLITVLLVLMSMVCNSQSIVNTEKLFTNNGEGLGVSSELSGSSISGNASVLLLEYGLNFSYKNDKHYLRLLSGGEYINEDNEEFLDDYDEEQEPEIKYKSKVVSSKIYKIPDIRFNSYITMPSSDFQTYISDLSNISNEIQFTYNKALKLRAVGDFADQSIIINETNDNSAAEEQHGTYNTKYILLFTKCTNLCSTVEIYLKTGYPLTILYNVANLGQIKYCLAPK